MRRRAFLNGLLLSPLCNTALADPAVAMQETPMFAERVKGGTLPPVNRRLPGQPLVVRTFAGDDGPGRQRGQLTMLVSGTRDTVLMTIYSYTRLIVYDAAFTLRPDILESWESNGGREFTFKLRAGHKWSDGHPFTTEGVVTLTREGREKPRVPHFLKRRRLPPARRASLSYGRRGASMLT